MIGLPAIKALFLPGTPFEPARAGMIASMKSSLRFNHDACDVSGC
jgi:hypothetical protein